MRNRKVQNYVLSDLNGDLITLWSYIKDDPMFLYEMYKYHWDNLKSFESIDKKKIYYNNVRESYNRYRRPEDFLFLSRTCVNGLIRYNKSGMMNTAFHLSRDGIKPESLREILLDWSEVLGGRDKNNNQIREIDFFCADYRDIIRGILFRKAGLGRSVSDDFVYLDPPYGGTKDGSMYFGGIDKDEFFGFLDELNFLSVKWAVSYDGVVKNKNGEVVQDNRVSGESGNGSGEFLGRYKRSVLIDSGNSSNRRLFGVESERGERYVEESYI